MHFMSSDSQGDTADWPSGEISFAFANTSTAETPQSIVYSQVGHALKSAVIVDTRWVMGEAHTDVDRKRTGVTDKNKQPERIV